MSVARFNSFIHQNNEEITWLSTQLKQNSSHLEKLIQDNRIAYASTMTRTDYDRFSDMIVTARNQILKIQQQLNTMSEHVEELLDSYNDSFSQLNRIFFSGQNRLQFMAAQQVMKKYPEIEGKEDTVEAQALKQAFLPVSKVSPLSDKKKRKSKKKTNSGSK